MSGKAFIGKPAPDFRASALIDGDFKEVSLADYRGKYVVFFFYPNDFTFVCPTELVAFSDRSDEFKQIGTVLLAVSTSSVFTHLAWTQQERKVGGLGQMRIPLLADKSHHISRDYGVLNEAAGVAYRGLFIIDGKGILRQITINDMPVGRSVDETLRLVQAFKYTDEHGEVCPADWKPGKASINPSVKASKTYFEKEL
jgi:alkyl hydroperoxide reductase subunit AhpC